MIGNPDRIGETSANWTLKAQVDRDPEVVEIKRRCDLAHHCRRILNVCLNDKLNIVKKHREQCRAHLLRSVLKTAETDKEKAQMRLDWDKRRDGWTLFWHNHVRTKYAGLFHLLRFVDDKTLCLCLKLDVVREQKKQELIATARAVLCTVQTCASFAFHCPEMALARSRISIVVTTRRGRYQKQKLVLVSMLSPRCVIAIGDDSSSRRLHTYQARAM